MEKNKFHIYTILAVILFSIAIIILFFLNGKETHITEEKTQDIISSVYCSSNKIENMFFDSSSTNKVKNEIKALFKNDVLDQLFYTYTGKYGSNDNAEHDEAVQHAKYNIYFGENGASPDILSPSFSTIEDKFSITLYAEKLDYINSITSKLFFISEDEITKFKGNSIESVKLFYENKGFTCEIGN